MGQEVAAGLPAGLQVGVGRVDREGRADAFASQTALRRARLLDGDAMAAAAWSARLEGIIIATRSNEAHGRTWQTDARAAHSGARVAVEGSAAKGELLRGGGHGPEEGLRGGRHKKACRQVLTQALVQGLSVVR